MATNKTNEKVSKSKLKPLPAPFDSKKFSLDFYSQMVKSRVLEERLIKIYRAGESYFWLGSPGEEAWELLWVNWSIRAMAPATIICICITDALPL
jgi:TPP-dependent pyruvate/acetoin dehydrogenase alpha subunit